MTTSHIVSGPRVHSVELTTDEIVTLLVALAFRLSTTNEITRPQVLALEDKLYRVMGIDPPKAEGQS